VQPSAEHCSEFSQAERRLPGPGFLDNRDRPDSIRGTRAAMVQAWRRRGGAWIGASEAVVLR